MRTVAKPEGKRKRAQEIGVDRETLEAEVTALAASGISGRAGSRGMCAGPKQQGPVYLGDQKLPIWYPRVRNQRTNEETGLPHYSFVHQIT